MAMERKIVVTGVSSFIGCHIARYLAGRRYRVIGTVSGNPDGYTDIRRERLEAAASSKVRLERLDLTDGGRLEAFIAAEKPDVWIHHAGYVKGYDGWDYDLRAANETNVLPLSRLYEALSASGCKGVVVTGTQSEYGESDKALAEDEACWPASAYGLSKLAETIRARQLSAQYGLPTRVARIFIPFGPLDTPKKLFPSAIASLSAGIPLELTPCEQKRDYCHIGDLAKGYECLIGDLARGPLFDVFNLCSGSAIALKDFLALIAKHLGADAGLLQFGRLPMRPGESMVCYGSNEKAGRLLGWQPRPLEESLESYIRELRSGRGPAV